VVDTTVRLLDDAELPLATQLIGRQMLGPITPEVDEGWAELFRDQGNVLHGAVVGTDLVGVVAWFPTDLSTPGEPLPAAGVTGVAVLSTHRRQGHLRRLMDAQLRHVADAGCPVAVLIAAEHPIYGRFGYGPATEACAIRFDTTAAFADPPSGRIELVDPAELHEPLARVYEASRARIPGGLRRIPRFWEHQAGAAPVPGQPFDPGRRRGALWYDDAGQLQGALTFAIEERWTRNRPDGTAEVHHLYGATPEAERELWRHLTTIDWVRTATASTRPVDDPLPFWLVDGRAATSVDRSDNVWLRLLDLPAAFAARRSPIGGAFVAEVVDPHGFAAGRFAIELGPDGGAAVPTTASPDVTLGAAALGAAFLGGHTLARLAAAGLVEDHGGLARASALLQTPIAPWCPVGF
jgi:predicted acetyltransferase